MPCDLWWTHSWWKTTHMDSTLIRLEQMHKRSLVLIAIIERESPVLFLAIASIVFCQLVMGARLATWWPFWYRTIRQQTIEGHCIEHSIHPLWFSGTWLLKGHWTQTVKQIQNVASAMTRNCLHTTQTGATPMDRTGGYQQLQRLWLVPV